MNKIVVTCGLRKITPDAFKVDCNYLDASFRETGFGLAWKMDEGVVFLN